MMWDYSSIEQLFKKFCTISTPKKCLLPCLLFHKHPASSCQKPELLTPSAPTSLPTINTPLKVASCKMWDVKLEKGLLLFHFVFCAYTSPGNEKTRVVQMCGGLGIQVRNKSTFPAMILPDSFRGWQSTWFYCKDQPTPGQSTGLPPFSMA